MHEEYRKYGLLGPSPTGPVSPWADAVLGAIPSGGTPEGPGPGTSAGSQAGGVASAAVGSGAGPGAGAGAGAEVGGGVQSYGTESDLLLSFVHALMHFLDPVRVTAGTPGTSEGASLRAAQGSPERTPVHRTPGFIQVPEVTAEVVREEVEAVSAAGGLANTANSQGTQSQHRPGGRLGSHNLEAQLHQQELDEPELRDTPPEARAAEEPGRPADSREHHPSSRPAQLQL